MLQSDPPMVGRDILATGPVLPGALSHPDMHSFGFGTFDLCWRSAFSHACR